MIKKLACLIILVFLHSFLSTEMIELDRAYFADNQTSETQENICELIEACLAKSCFQKNKDCPAQCLADCKESEKPEILDISIFEAHI